MWIIIFVTTRDYLTNAHKLGNWSPRAAEGHCSVSRYWWVTSSSQLTAMHFIDGLRGASLCYLRFCCFARLFPCQLLPSATKIKTPILPDEKKFSFRFGISSSGSQSAHTGFRFGISSSTRIRSFASRSLVRHCHIVSPKMLLQNCECTVPG